MKVALLGNMNNGNFSLLRYLLERNIDATLLLWKNDGQHSHSHFNISNDTWNLRKWSKYIKRTNINNSISALIYNPLKHKNYVKQEYFKKIYDKYDVFISSGIAPALFCKFNEKLDIFYPYAMGVEWIDTYEEKIENNLNIKNIIYKKVKKLQIKGLKSCKKIINPELGKTEQTLKRLKIKSHKIYVPIVYKEKKKNFSFNLIKKIKKYDFSIISHARHLWKPSKVLNRKDNIFNSKNNDWLIYGFKEFLNETESNSCLILFEYGPDYKESKKLCKKLDIQKNVIWLPVLPRKKILKIIQNCKVGVGEFYLQKNTIWGGTAIEVLSQGIPTLQTFRFNNFKKIFKKKPPPFIKINNKFEIKQQLVKLYNNKNFRKKIGYNSKKWFEKEYEISLIDDWIKIINKCFNK